MITSELPFMQDYNETVEELAATVAHEIKNPISLALANLYMIKTEDREQRFIRYCKVIEKELHKINCLAMDFIDSYNHNESYVPGQLMERSEINKLIADVVEDFEEAGVTGISYYPSVDILVMCDAKRLSIVFTNLIKNALEAIEDGGSVKISVNEGIGNVTVKIKDDGPGFSQAAMSMEHAYTSKPGGSGLGLKICRNNIARHGGSLNICNNQDKGATVLVTLPVSG